jgi:hypothetical protein
MDFHTVTPIREMAIRLALACLFGMVLGLDREFRGKSAGLRTHMLVALSSAATTLVTLEIFETLKAAGHTDMDPLRIVQGLAQAIGFICAGVIIQSRGDVHGLQRHRCCRRRWSPHAGPACNGLRCGGPDGHALHREMAVPTQPFLILALDPIS